MSPKSTNYKFFSHTNCEYYPCHKLPEGESFNCIFCYCPLYALGKDCGGHFQYNEKGYKDCSRCNIPHIPRNYDYILSKYPKIAEIAARK